MWKDFFYFSKGQRIALVILLVLIALACGFDMYLNEYQNVETKENADFLQEAHGWEKSLIRHDSILKLQWQQKYTSKYQTQSSYPAAKEETYTLFKFDPNKADAKTFTSLGLKPYIAANILKFRATGAKFRTVESFSKVYGIKPDKFKELEPYIVIDPALTLKPDTIKPKFKIAVKDKNYVVELNAADTTELMKVPGIGRSYAKAIVRFRQQTGGFVSLEQLREVYGMTVTNFEKVSPNCRINPNLVQKININTASAEKLNAHPYLNFYQAKAIYEYRRRKGKLKSIKDLEVLDELSPETIQRIQAYLSFQ